MPDDYFAKTTAPAAEPRKPGGKGRLILGVAVLSFLLGGGLVGWLVYDGKLHWTDTPVTEAPARLATNAPATDAAPVESPATPPSLTAPIVLPPALTAGIEQRMAQLEQRLSTLDLQAQTATGNAARAEGLLIALASRRAIERGVPLGLLGDQLRLRFGEAQPRAVQLLIGEAKPSATLDQLDAGLKTLSIQLNSAAAAENSWDRFARQIANMFVIRRTESSAIQPDLQLDRARLLLRSGQAMAAADLIAALPANPAASAWVAQARRYASVQQALDQVEVAAILEPRKLQDGAGQIVQPNSPIVQ